MTCFENDFLGAGWMKGEFSPFVSGLQEEIRAFQFRRLWLSKFVRYGPDFCSAS
jgi:hypothetical protein